MNEEAAASRKLIDAVRPYAIAVSSVGAVFGLTILIVQYVPTDVSPLYLVAVMFAAWRGGLGAGLLATILSVAIATYFFLPPLYSFSLKPEGVVELIVFSLAAILTGSLNAARERALGLERLARRDAEKANRVKDEFVAAVSHELRTPLTTIKTLTRLLLKKDPPEELRREYLEDISTECERQIDFVHNLLDLSRIDAGDVQVQTGPVEPESVLRDCENIEKVTAADRSHTLTVTVEPDLPAVKADRNALRRSLCAIVENAIKYTPEGGSISLSAARGRDAESVSIKVTDNGPGIDERDLPHLFERFYRGRRLERSGGTDPSEVSGVGLGLHLASELIEGMGGTIAAENVKAGGSIFTVKLPIWQDDSAEQNTLT